MIYLLDGADPEAPFPDPALAERDPNGLLALGGDLSPRRLLNAYRHGIFPWFAAGQPILWWSPDPRMVLYPDELRLSRSLRKTLRRGRYQVSFDQAFTTVIRACAGPRDGESGTWLVPEMIEAYARLHRLGAAHAVETWQDERLVGGLYGVALGRVFFGESMFSRASDASKVALVALVQLLRRHGFAVIDCQVYTSHLESLGARQIPRAQFVREIEQAIAAAPPAVDWSVPRTATARLLDAA
jgi:leucyl/phenylalanyl-tRNA--protein transferase